MGGDRVCIGLFCFVLGLFIVRKWDWEWRVEELGGEVCCDPVASFREKQGSKHCEFHARHVNRG